jgi:hypothetical protein
VADGERGDVSYVEKFRHFYHALSRSMYGVLTVYGDWHYPDLEMRVVATQRRSGGFQRIWKKSTNNVHNKVERQGEDNHGLRATECCEAGSECYVSKLGTVHIGVETSFGM